MFTLARVLVNRLGIAVLGMRYPVQDEFAIALAKELYPAILESGQSVDIAAGLAIPDAAGSQPTAGRPALSICTPALFGPAVGLKFQGDSKIAKGSRVITMSNHLARGVRCAAAHTVL